MNGPHSSPGVGNPMGIIAVAWSPDSRMLASAGYDAMIRYFRCGRIMMYITLRQGGWCVLWLHWSTDGPIIHRCPQFRVWDVGTGEQLSTLVIGHLSFHWDLGSDEHYLLIDDHTSTYLCDMITGERHPFSGPHTFWIGIQCIQWRQVEVRRQGSKSRCSIH